MVDRQATSAASGCGSSYRSTTSHEVNPILTVCGANLPDRAGADEDAAAAATAEEADAGAV